MSDGVMLEAIAKMPPPRGPKFAARTCSKEISVEWCAFCGRSPVISAEDDRIAYASDASGACDEAAKADARAAGGRYRARHFRSSDSELALEHKLDGARVQIHCAAGMTRIFSRRLNEITNSLPEIAEQMKSLGDRNVIFDGEVIAVDSKGNTLPFQELMRRLGRRRDVERARAALAIRLYLFDLLALDGELWIDKPYTDRTAVAKRGPASGAESNWRGDACRSRRKKGDEFYRRAIEAGFEGVVAKSLASKYTPGARGRGWLKIKTRGRWTW